MDRRDKAIVAAILIGGVMVGALLDVAWNKALKWAYYGKAL